MEHIPQAFPRPRLRQASFLRELLDTALLVLLVYTLVNLATVRFFIEGPSMQPNFYAGQFLIVSRVHYLLGDPQRGEIVVFDSPGSAEGAPSLIKRLIGLPGDQVEFRANELYINGERLNEPYIKEVCERCRDQSWSLGPDEYFLMGDNRNNSHDSRAFGPVNRSRIIGEAVVRYWPVPDIGIVTRYLFPAS